MKTVRQWTLVGAALLGLSQTYAAWNTSDGIFYLKTGDGLETYTVDGSITFKSQSAATIPSYRDCGVVFTPARPGEVIQITVESNDLTGDNYLLLYNNAIEKIGYGVSDGKDQSGYLPAGWSEKYQTGSAGSTFTSTATDGALSFGFHSTSSTTGQSGFTITVTSIALTDMQLKSATIDGADGLFRGCKDAPLATLQLTTEGGLNPFDADEIEIDASALAAAGVTDIRLMSGSEVLASGSTLRASALPLRAGKNDFVITGTLPADFAGQLPLPTVNTLIVNGNSQSPTIGENPVVANEIRIASTDATYVISDNASFYDDGGKENKIALNFSGQVTFVPATEGMAVKIDFTTLDLFNTSSIGKNDILKVYSGREANEENLLATVTEPRFVKSTAPDGSLTVTLVSTTGVAKEGWEATVSQFLPGNMTFTSADATLPADADTSVSAMQKDVLLMTVDVMTDNTANALELTDFQFDGITPDALAALRVVSLGEDTAVSSSHPLFASADNPAATTALNGNLPLKEGHNRFAIIADIADNVLSGSKINLSLKGLTIAGQLRTLLNGEVERTVANVFNSKEGVSNVTIRDNWAYRPTFSESTPGKYAIGTADQTVTFTPAEEGAVAQIDFSQFDLSSQAKFAIYNGSACTSDALIWEVTSTNRTEGPGQTLRSSAPDGSMTIRFNPNTTYSYYTSTGWEAVVKPFINHPMSIIDASATLPLTDAMPIGGSDQKLLDAILTAEGNLTVKTLKSLTLNIDGADQLSAVKVYASQTNDRSTAILFGQTAEVAPSTAVAGEFAMAEGANYFWVEADVKADAKADTPVKAAIVSATDTEGLVQAIEGCSTEDARILKNILILESGDHTLSLAQDLMWYDDGGAEGKISPRIAATYTFIPAEEGYAVTANAEAWSMGNGYVYFYSGHTADAANALGKSTGYGTTSGPANLKSTAPDGSMTVKVTGPTGTTLDGFALRMGLHERVDFTPGETTAAAPEGASSDILRGSSATPLLMVKTTVEGDKGDAQYSGFTFNLDGTTDLADIASLHLLESDYPDFSPALAREVATAAPAATITFDEPVSTTKEGTKYFFLTADIKPEATAGNTVAATLASLNFNGDAVALTSSTAASRTIKAGMKGEYTVGANGNYATLAAAAEALKQGVEGAVTFLIADGRYTENVVIESVPGAGETCPITFRSASADRSKVIIAGNYSALHKDGAVRIIGTPYVTFSDVSVNVSTSYDNGVYIANGSHHATLRNCAISADKVTGYTGISLVRTYTSTSLPAGYSNDFFTIENCALTGGRIGMYLAGQGLVDLPFVRGLVVRGNSVTDVGSKAMYIIDREDAIITGNTITTPSAAKSYSALELYRVRGGGEISGNRILTDGAADTNGIYLRNGCGGTADSPLRIFNNDVNLLKSTSYTGRALQIYNDNTNIELAYNTFRTAGAGAYTFATAGSGTPANISMHDNILANDCTTSAIAMMFWNSTDIDGYTFSRNALYTSDPTQLVKNDSPVIGIDDFNALTDGTNFVSRPDFAADADSHLLTPGDMQCGTPCSFVTVDADGKPRPASSLTLGAYEYGEISTDAPALAEGYPTVRDITVDSAKGVTLWDMDGKLYATAIRDGEPLPDTETMLALPAVNITAGSEVTSTFTQLDEQTLYTPCYLAVSNLGTVGEVIAGEPFSTLRNILPLAVALGETTVINDGDEVVLTPDVSGGDAPYTYLWTAQDGSDLGTDATLTVTPDVSQRYTLQVTSADGQSVTARRGIEVRGESRVATFDDNAVADLYPETGTTRWYSGSYAFNCGASSMSGMKFWFGYTLSNEEDNSFATLDDQFRSAAGGGFESANYAVGYPQGLSIDVTHDADGDIIEGVYVTNAAYAYSSMLNGDGYAKPFTQDSWFKLTARGTAADGTASTVDFYLADYRDSDPAERYILDTWQWLDLRPLGKVQKVTFTLSGSESNQFGLVTPAYLCLDRFGALPVMESYDVSLTDEGAVDLDTFLADDTLGGTPRYAISPVEYGSQLPFILNGNMLSFDTRSRIAVGETIPVIASVTRAGRSQYALLNISRDLDTGIANAGYDIPCKVTADNENIRVRTSLSDYTIEVISASGIVLHSSTGHNGDTTVRLTGVPNGIYMVKITNSAFNRVTRLIL